MFRFSKLFIVSKLTDYNWYKNVLKRNIGCICEHLSSSALLKNCVFKSFVGIPQHHDVLCSSENIIVCGTVLWRKKYVSKYIIGRREYHMQRKFSTKTTITDDTTNDKKHKTGNASSNTPKKPRRNYIRSTPKIKSLDLATNSLAVNKRTKKHAIEPINSNIFMNLKGAEAGIKLAEEINKSKAVSELKQRNESVESKKNPQYANENVPKMSPEIVEDTNKGTLGKAKETAEDTSKEAIKVSIKIDKDLNKKESKESKEIAEGTHKTTSKESKEIAEGTLKETSTDAKEIVEETDKTSSKERKEDSDKKISKAVQVISKDTNKKEAEEVSAVSEGDQSNLLKEIARKKILKESKESFENTKKRATKESEDISEKSEKKRELKPNDNETNSSQNFVKSVTSSKVEENNKTKSVNEENATLNAPKIDERKIETEKATKLNEVNKMNDDENTNADMPTLVLSEPKFDTDNKLKIDKESKEISESKKIKEIASDDSTVNKTNNKNSLTKNEAEREKGNLTAIKKVVEMTKQANDEKNKKIVNNSEASEKVDEIIKSIKKTKKTKKSKKKSDKTEKITKTIKKTLAESVKQKMTKEINVGKKSPKAEEKNRKKSEFQPSHSLSINIEEQKEHISKADLPPKKVHIEYIESKNLKDVEITKSSPLGHNVKPKRRRRLSKRRQETTTDPMVLKLIRRSQLNSETLKSYENKKTSATNPSLLNGADPLVENREMKKTSQKKAVPTTGSINIKAPEIDHTSKISAGSTNKSAVEADKNSSISTATTAVEASETEKAYTANIRETSKTNETNSISELNTDDKSKTIPGSLKSAIKTSRISEISKMSYIESKMNPALRMKFQEHKSSSFDLKTEKLEDNKFRSTQEKKSSEKTAIENLEDLGPSTNVYILATTETEKIIESDPRKIIMKSNEKAKECNQKNIKNSQKDQDFKTRLTRMEFDDFIDKKLSLRTITEAEVEKKLKSKSTQLSKNDAPLEGRTNSLKADIWESETPKTVAEDTSPTSSTSSFKQEADLVPNADTIKWGAYLPPEATSTNTPKKPYPAELKDERTAATETINDNKDGESNYNDGTTKKTYMRTFTYTLWTVVGSSVVYFLADILSHDEINSMTPILTFNKYLSAFQTRTVSHETNKTEKEDKKEKKDKMRNKEFETEPLSEFEIKMDNAKDEENFYSGDEGF